jgi:hypothetical protein
MLVGLEAGHLWYSIRPRFDDLARGEPPCLVRVLSAFPGRNPEGLKLVLPQLTFREVPETVLGRGRCPDTVRLAINVKANSKAPLWISGINVTLAPARWRQPCAQTECSLHQLSPYIGKIKSSIAGELVERFSIPGDLVRQCVGKPI